MHSLYIRGRCDVGIVVGSALLRKNMVVVHLAAALWRLTNGAGTFGAWKIGA